MRIFFAIFLLVLSVRGSAQISEDSFWERDGDLTEDLIAKLERAVVVIDNETTNERLSGILVMDGSKLFALTNSHLFSAGSDRVAVYFESKDGIQEKLQANLIENATSYDLALLSVADTERNRKKMKTMGFTFDENGGIAVTPSGDGFLSTSQFGSASLIARGREVMFLGFPLNQGTSEKSIPIMRQNEYGETVEVAEIKKLIAKSPVARFGRIASKPSDGIFLIDAMVSHGSSGSPVFVREGHIDGANYQSSYRLIGIISRFKSDDIVFRSEDGSEMSIPHNSGLGIVIPIDAINDVIQRAK